MSVTTTTTPASRRALTTVERYRAIMPAPEGVNDAKLETLIAQASAAIETYLGRRLARERITERLVEEPGTKIVLLERRPVVTIHTVKIAGETLDTALWSLDGPEAGLLRLTGYGSNDLWDELVGDYGGGSYGYRGGTPQPLVIEVDHTAGYIVPEQTFGEDSTPDLPLEIEAACQTAVQAYLEASDRPAGLTSEKLGDASWTYAQGGGGRGFMTDDVKALLTGYRTVAI